MAHDSQESIAIKAVESLYRDLFNRDPKRAGIARAVAKLALADARETLAIDDNDAQVVGTAFEWVAFDYTNERAAVGSGYLAHAIRWRSGHRRTGSATLGTDFRDDVIEMRARDCFGGTDALERNGAGWTFSMAYEDVAGETMFGYMEYPEYPISTR